jgi:hypothetical protein
MKTSHTTRSLYDCTSVPLTPTGPEMRLVIATHPGTSSDPAVGTLRDGTALTSCLPARFPPQRLRLRMCLPLYLHRGSFETVLADEDKEQDADRWYGSLPLAERRFAQILAKSGMERIERELGHLLSPSELRTTEFAPAHEAETPSTDEPEPAAAPPPAVTYGPLKFARPSFTHGFPGSAFSPQPDGTLRCPANHPLYLQERRPERDGSLRLLYAARIGRHPPYPPEEEGGEWKT